MAARIVRNDFVAGEIDPALFGRHDVEMFFHGASRVENFVPRKTGGLRKRAGTDLVWHVAGTAGETRDYRIVPYRYDKDEYGLIALYRKGTATQVWYRFWSSRTKTATNEAKVAFLSVSTDVSLDAIKHGQIGDTIFFTLHGYRAWTARVTFSTRSVAWKQLRTSIAVASPPALTTTASGFHAEGDGYVAAYREYAIWGVKNGIRSDIRTKRQSMTLTWVAGAYIDVTFTPNWANHDYYILGKLQGGQYGEVARFYRDSDNGSRSDFAAVSGGSQKATGTFNGETYTAALSSVADSGGTNSPWRTTAPDTISNGIHSCGSWVASVGMTHSSSTAPLLALKLWFGAKMNGGESVANVGYSDTVHAVLYKGSESGAVVAEWDFTPGYQEDAAKLSIDNPKAGPSFGLFFYTDATRSTRAYVPMRGMVMCTDTGTKKFHDDNISPGTLVGEQDLLQVGFAGMDVDIITTWQQRLVAASAEQSPFTMWFSALGDLYNFYVDRPQVADNAFEATIASTEANRILHIVSQKWLLAFTESGEHVIDATGGAFAFNTISIKKTSSVGAHPDIVPTTTESDVLFVAADGRSVYKMDYSLERDAVVPSSVSTRAQHITELHRIKKIAYQRYPDSVLWCLLDDGSLASMTFVPEENVCGWARHTLAGGAGLKAVDIFATGSIRADADTDTTSDLMLVLEDTATNGKKGDVWVERLRPCVVSDSPAAAHAECADHMGYAAANYPSGGDPKGEVQARLVTMRLEPQQADMIGKQTNAFDTVLRIRRSGLVAVRPDKSELPWSGTVTQPDAQPVESGSSVALVEKDVKIAPRAFQNRDARLEIKSADKWPCEILSLLAMMEFGNQKWGG